MKGLTPKCLIQGIKKKTNKRLLYKVNILIKKLDVVQAQLSAYLLICSYVEKHTLSVQRKLNFITTKIKSRNIISTVNVC